ARLVAASAGVGAAAHPALVQRPRIPARARGYSMTAAPVPERRAPRAVEGRSAATLSAMRWERRVMRAAHPIAFPALELLRRPVQRVPRLGVVVRDADLLRGVLMDPERFTKTGPGSPADLWTPVLGPKVLLNMEGEEHLALRRKLGPLFSPVVVGALVQ